MSPMHRTCIAHASHLQVVRACDITGVAGGQTSDPTIRIVKPAVAGLHTQHTHLRLRHSTQQQGCMQVPLHTHTCTILSHPLSLARGLAPCSHHHQGMSQQGHWSLSSRHARVEVWGACRIPSISSPPLSWSTCSHGAGTRSCTPHTYMHTTCVNDGTSHPRPPPARCWWPCLLRAAQRA